MYQSKVKRTKPRWHVRLLGRLKRYVPGRCALGCRAALEGASPHALLGKQHGQEGWCGE